MKAAHLARRFSRLPTAPIQRYLRWIQLTLYSASCVFALVSCVTLKVSYEDLGFECPLYAKPSKVNLQSTKNGTYVLHLGDEVKKGEKKTCFYSMYLNVTIASYSLIWGLLYGFLSAPSKARKGHLRHLVFPSLLFNSVLFTSELIASCVLSLGYNFWCESIVNDLEALENVKKLIETKKLVLTCPLIQTFPWKFDDKSIEYFTGPRFFGLITITQIASWMVSLTTLVLSIICGERFFKSVWFGEQEEQQFQEAAAAAAAELSAAESTESANRPAGSGGGGGGGGGPEFKSASTRLLLNGMIRENQGALAAGHPSKDEPAPLLPPQQQQQQQQHRQHQQQLQQHRQSIAPSAAAATTAAIVSSPSDSAGSEELSTLHRSQQQHHQQHRLGLTTSTGSQHLGGGSLGLVEPRGLVTSAHLHAPAIGCLQSTRIGPPQSVAPPQPIGALAAGAAAYQETALWEPRLQQQLQQPQQPQQQPLHPFTSLSAATATANLIPYHPAACRLKRIWNSSAQCSECLALQQQYPHGVFYGPSRLEYAWRDQY